MLFVQELFILDSSGKEIFTEIAEKHVSSVNGSGVLQQQHVDDVHCLSVPWCCLLLCYCHHGSYVFNLVC